MTIPLKVVSKYGYTWFEINKDKDTIKSASKQKEQKSQRPYWIDLFENFGGLL
jgi:hypothetical protein